ncbi:hypothetical protein DFJ74DRAFT_682003 [Hyaloraphidium curvatum]|nr:hypothetical protein DFJ74DRAFT_682003 [Hyaloraphidium curvatum]
MCPCDLPSCAGKLPRQAVYWRLAWVVTLASLNYALFLFFAYTPFVTLRATFWNTAWCAAAAAIYCAFNLVFYGIMANARFSANVSALSLGSRLSHRAIAASLRSLLSRLHTALEAGRTADVTSALASSEESDELYVRLHTMLVRAWRSRITTLSSGGGSFLVLYFGTSVVCAVANIAAGNCIPGYGVVIFSLGIFNVLWDIIHFAVSNSGVDGARRLYLAARTDLRKVLARLPVPLDPARAEWAAKVEHHERLLSAFAEVDDCRSRFLGFAVTYGTARTLVVTGLTVFVGLYSILRGVGVRVVGDFACPPL